MSDKSCPRCQSPLSSRSYWDTRDTYYWCPACSRAWNLYADGYLEIEGSIPCPHCPSQAGTALRGLPLCELWQCFLCICCARCWMKGPDFELKMVTRNEQLQMLQRYRREGDPDPEKTVFVD